MVELTRSHLHLLMPFTVPFDQIFATLKITSSSKISESPNQVGYLQTHFQYKKIL